MTASSFSPQDLERLQELAQLNQVATNFWDWHGNLKEVQPRTLIRALQALGIDVPDNPSGEQLQACIKQFEDAKWMTILPPTTVKRVGAWQEIYIHVPDGESVHVSAVFENGNEQALVQIENWDPPRVVDGQARGRAAFALERDFPLGYHQLKATLGNGQTASAHLIVVPNALDVERRLSGQRWGIASQLYSVRSAQCWGMGDAATLKSLNEAFGHMGADFHQINPVHAAAPVVPVEPSPYLPVTRQFTSAIYIHPESIPEYDAMPAMSKAHIKQLHKLSREEDSDRMGLINRDQSWTAKVEALWEIYRHGLDEEREAQFEAFMTQGGDALIKFATWSALVEKFGMDLPSEFEDSDGEDVAQFARENAKLVRFHMWMQWVVSEQLQQAQEHALEAGMDIGIMSDLAVGVHPYGSEVWSDPHMFASGMTVGAPPDMYSQLGQNWSQPPWNPRALAECGYQPLRRMIRTASAFSGAIRIDHILGLFRLWWIPSGQSADQGTYVHYDHEALVGVLLLEALRANSVVIGEDLGTVEPWVREYLNERGILGTSIMWFEREGDGSPLRAQNYRRDVLAAVNTHDLPPTAGYIAGIQTTIREELGLLVDPIEHVRAVDRQELDSFSARMVEYGLLEADQREDDQALINAFYRYIACTPSRLLSVSLVDIVRERRPQNFPGTHKEYPNWQVPLGDETGQEVTLERMTPRYLARFAHLMNEAVGKS